MNITFNSIKTSGIFLIMAVLVWGCASTGETTSSQDSELRPHEKLVFPELRPTEIAEVHRFEYNGIQFFLVEDSELPLIDMNVIVRAGSWMVPENLTGLASMTGSVMRNGGSVNYPSDELNELLESRAASIETGFGSSSGSASMNALSEDFADLLPVFIDLLKNPLFPEDKLDVDKTQRRSAISRRNDQPSQIAGREFNKLIYGEGSQLARVQEYDHVNNIQVEHLRDFHARAFRAPNLMVGLSGDFTVEEIRPLLEEAFGDFPNGDRNEVEFDEIDYEFESTLNFVHRGDMTQSIIRMGHIGGFRDNPDYAALQLMNRVLSGGFSGRLMQEVRTRLGLAYSVGGSYTSNVFTPGIFFASLSTAAESTADAVNATLNEIKRLTEEPVTQSELDDARDRFLNSLVFRNENRSSVLAQQMNFVYQGLPLDTFDKLVEEIQEVTVDDVFRVAQEYLQPDKLHILIVGNRDLIEDQLAELGDFNEIDITIPRPGEAGVREAITGDADAGAELLGSMASALLHGNTFSSVTFTGKTELPTPQGNMSLDTEITYGFPDSFRQDLMTPMGTQSLIYENGRAKVVAGPQEQDLPSEMAEQFRTTLHNHYFNIALNAGSKSALYIGSEERDSGEYSVIYISDLEIKLFLDKETSLPAYLVYEIFDASEGGDVEVEVAYTNWNTSGNITAAHKEVSKSAGTTVTSNFTSHSTE